MRRPVVTAMSGISVAVLGISLHASQRSSSAAVGAAPTGLVQGVPSPVTDSSRTAPTHADPTTSPPPRPSPSPVRTKAAPATRTPTQSATALPSRTRAARSSPPSPAAAPTSKPAATTVVVNGSPADTQYGPVQVQITLRAGHIIKAHAIEYPQDSGRDQEINSQAIPQLDQETVQADSAQIDTVSGATYTSGGYRQSLQSALDAAHRAGAR